MWDAQAATGHAAAGEVMHLESLKPQPKSMSVGCILAILIFFKIFLPLFSQPPGAVPGTQPLLPNSMDPTRQQGKPIRGGLNINVSR